MRSVMWTKKTISILFLVFISFLICFQINFFNPNHVDFNFISYEEPVPKTSQLSSNFTVNIFKPELIMIEGHLGMNITSAIPGQIHCSLTERSGDRYFVKINQSFNIIGNNQSQLFVVKAIPLITTFPGEYYFTLNITGLIEYSDNFNIFLGMGYSLFSIILAFIAIIVIIAILNQKKILK